MRDPNRIPQILNRLRAVWLTYPHLRLGQLLGNVFCPDGESLVDKIYNMGDEEFIGEIEKYSMELRIESDKEREEITSEDCDCHVFGEEL